MTEAELAAFRRGEAEFFRNAVEVHSGRLFAYARSYVPDEASAEDVVQETWLRAYRKRETFRGEGSFVGWLLAIARSVALDLNRKPTLRRQPTPVVPEGSSVAVHKVEDRLLGQGDRLRAALAELPPRQRDTVVLRILEDRSIRESAEILGVAEGTVKATLHRALHNLRALIQSDPREESF